MNKKWLAMVLALVMTFTLAACGGDKGTDEPVEENGSEVETPADETAFKVAMVTDEGGVSDQSFNQSAYEGLLQAQEDFNVEISYQESHQDADYAPNFEILLDTGNDLMWGVGFKLADATYNAALMNPDKLYGIIDYAYEDTPENLVGVVFKAEQPSFLVGYIAGMMTETDQIGFVGGIEGDVIWGFDYGFQAGVQYAANELGKEIDVLSQYAESFTDSARGKSIATNMYQQGRDIVFHAAGGVGDGVIEAAREQDKWVIGVDRDQSYMAPDNVLTSAMKRVDVAIYNVVELLTKGQFPGGQTIVYGLADGGAVDIAPTSDVHVPAEILEKVEELKQQIIEGTIVVPFNAETFEVFMGELQ